MTQKLLTLVVATLFFASATSAHSASSNCEVIYGGGYYGGQMCDEKISFTVDKQVQKPTKGGEFVNNLGANDEKFASGSTVNFRIIVKNNGEKTINNITVTDTLPQHLTWVSGGSRNGQNVTFTIKSLEAGKSVTLTVSAKASTAENLPSDKNVTCVVNNVKVTQNGNSATDSTQLCIEKTTVPQKGGAVVHQTPPMKQTPATGPEMLSLFALVPTGVAGLYLRRKGAK